MKPFDFGNSSFANAKNGRGFVRKNSISNMHCGFGRLYSPRRYKSEHDRKEQSQFHAGSTTHQKGMQAYTVDAVLGAKVRNTA